LFGPRQLLAAALQGAVVLTAVLGLYGWSLGSGVAAEQEARGAAFLALIVGNLALALADSAGSARIFAPHRRAYWIIVAIVAAVLTAILTVPLFAGVFDVAAPDTALLLTAVGVGLISGGWSGVIRLARPRATVRA
jgi:Ca2+-transporting ATPase